MANTAINHDPVATFPGSSTNTAVVKWSGTSGNALLDSGVLIDGSNNVTGLNNVTATGYLHLTGDEKELRFYEGANYIAIAAPSGLGADYTFTLPLNDGSADEFLQTNGSGVLTWAAAAGTTINSNADNRVITGSGTANTLNGESELTYTGGQITLNYDSGGAIINLDGSTGQTLVKYRNAGTTKWEIGMDADASSNQKSHVDDYGLYNGGTYGVVISGNGTNKFGIGTQAGIALSSAEIPDDGIQFPATQNANSSANNLDDYEEGTWTPLIQDHLLSDRSQAYSIQFGRYQKVGNRVHISGRVELNGLGSLTTTSGTRIAGFPFTSSSTTNNDYGVVVTYTEGLAMTANASVTGKIYTNTTYAYMFEWDSTLGVGGDGLTLAELSTDGHLEFFGSYEV
jgi:hypothetical protein